MSSSPPWSAVWALSVTEIVSWGTLYYAISVLIPPMEQELGWSRDAIVGAFSLSLLFAGIGTFPAGILIDRLGGRVVMSFGSFASAALLALLSRTHSIEGFYFIWAGLGLTMAMVLYEPAFAVITANFGSNARKAITILTLSGGLASSVFWPLTQGLVSALGWRHTLVALALLHLLVCAPLHAFLLPQFSKRGPERGQEADGPGCDDKAAALVAILKTRAFWMLAVAFAANMLAYSSLSVHLIVMLREKGYSMENAVWIAALIGPMQVIGRVGEFTIGSRYRAEQVALFALALLPAALIGLGFSGSALGPVIVFVAICGAGNGIMTIARGTIPAAIFGFEHYGAVNGALSAPVLASRALGPLIGSFVWSSFGNYDAMLWMLAAIALLAVVSFSFAISTAKQVQRPAGRQ
jgi:MFS family permease